SREKRFFRRVPSRYRRRVANQQLRSAAAGGASALLRLPHPRTVEVTPIPQLTGDTIPLSGDLRARNGIPPVKRSGCCTSLGTRPRRKSLPASESATR